MKLKSIETALGYTPPKNGRPAVYAVDPRFELADGRIIGRVRHYSYKAGSDRLHYHEANGKPHCTRTVRASEFTRVSS